MILPIIVYFNDVDRRVKNGYEGNAIHCLAYLACFFCLQVEERSRLNRQSSPAMPHKVANRISDPNLPPRSESFSISGVQAARTPPMHRPIDPQVFF